MRDPATGDVEIEVDCAPGVQVHLSEVVVEGNERTRTAFILARIEMKAGDLYDRRLERKAFRELYGTGIFDSVRIELVGAGPERVLRVAVEETETLSISAEVGYGAFERARLSVAVTEENLFGTGRTLSLEGKLAIKAKSVRFFLTDPWTFGKDYVLGLSTFYEARKNPSFDSKELGSGVNITHRYTPRFRNIYGYEYRFSDAHNISVEVPGEAIDEGNDAYVSALYLTSIYDSRDSVFLPTRGTWVRTRVEYAPEELASQLTFGRLDGRIARYDALGEQTLLAWTARAGVVLPIDSTDEIPLQERYFNGGQNSVRSFREGRLGPRDAGGHSIGGEGYTVLSVELRRKLLGNFTGALFVDAGNVSLGHEDFLDFADYRYGVGPGLRWLLPVGPLRLDWGINPNPRPDEPDWVLQFSVGVAF